ncbi:MULTISPECIES: hypothetical protein [Citrobacter]|jgi:general secretion pathway protein B|uniref:hypothetical protein n=1 Tax=Citrobacter TaxID=544 RepID=UPI00155F8299|nr:MULTISPECIES: hypothetical protein [Citrobacter]MBR7617128.1 hypothetical protein [Citrobacter braakii]MDL4473361.1 hypothetical protein [Citrobacter braakii]MDL4505090.1 hypothetical protein [Citrobacter braakii]MDM3378838.1 hypothetical protein [Citrobacter sp. Cb003]MDM3447853.1 hypothetical protein [Citrobacter sp. Cb027]
MMHIYQPIDAKTVSSCRWRQALRSCCWLLWVSLMLMCGYYGHYVWLVRHPTTTTQGVPDSQAYRLSDVHYIFKRKPLPIRIDLPTQNEEGDSMLEEIPYDEASGQEVPDGEVLRSRVQQALREIDGK